MINEDEPAIGTSPIRLGVSAEFVDFRNDVRRLMECLGREFDVNALLEDADSRHMSLLPANVRKRVVTRRPTMWSDRLVRFASKYFGQAPKSRRNYYVSLLFRIYKTREGWPRFKAKLDALLRYLAPRFLSFEKLMQLMPASNSGLVTDLDCMLFLSEIENLELASEWLATGKPMLVYIYSWDHPPKYVRFPKAAHFLGWNQDILQDLVMLHGIDPSQCHVIGATQFAFIEEYRRSAWRERGRPYEFRYIYFAASTGTIHLARIEVEFVRVLCKKLSRRGSELRVVFRPYPNLADWATYRPLQELPNLVLDANYRGETAALSEDAIMEKFWKIDEAAAVFHCGTTFGLEACFFETPSCIVDLFPPVATELVGMWDFVHQYQNEKYLLLSGYRNVIRSWDDVDALLDRVEKGDVSELLEYNNKIAERFDLVGFDAIASRVRQVAETVSKEAATRCSPARA